MMTIIKKHWILTTFFIAAIVFLCVMWWANGQDDTWLYIFCIGLIINSAWEVYSSKNKDKK